MKVEDVTQRASEVASVRRVFGEPIERAGVTIIPVAHVIGGGGGGSGGLATGDDDRQSGEAGGSGFGVLARPLGVFVIRDQGVVEWKPAVNPLPIILGAQACFIAAALVYRAVAKARIRARA